MKTGAALCAYRRLDNGIHEFVFAESSRASFDVFIDQLDDITQATPPHEKLYTLLDWRQSGMPPLRYAFQRSQTFVKRYPHHSGGRTAFLYRSGTLISLVQSFVDVLHSKAQARFFVGDQREAAIAWLLEDAS